MERVVQREWLDDLAADDPLAVRSRLDIQRLNILTGHDRIMADALKATLNGRASACIAELGAGNGDFLLSVARRLKGHRPEIEATLVDRADGFQPKICDELKKLNWNPKIQIADAQIWLRETRFPADVIITNQFLHEFQSSELADMLRCITTATRALIALEPRRGAWPLFCSRLVGFVGCGAVTRRDAPISVRAGFTGDELSQLWPDQKNWELTERRSGQFSHLFMARRKE